MVVGCSIPRHSGSLCYICLQANIGDSRAIASVEGTVQQLSFDHKPNNELETRRIVAAGGWVEFNRVNGWYIGNMYWCIANVYWYIANIVLVHSLHVLCIANVYWYIANVYWYITIVYWYLANVYWYIANVYWYNS